MPPKKKRTKPAKRRDLGKDVPESDPKKPKGYVLFNGKFQEVVDGSFSTDMNTVKATGEELVNSEELEADSILICAIYPVSEGRARGVAWDDF